MSQDLFSKRYVLSLCLHLSILSLYIVLYVIEMEAVMVKRIKE